VVPVAMKAQGRALARTALVGKAVDGTGVGSAEAEAVRSGCGRGAVGAPHDHRTFGSAPFPSMSPHPHPGAVSKCECVAIAYKEAANTGSGFSAHGRSLPWRPANKLGRCPCRHLPGDGRRCKLRLQSAGRARSSWGISSRRSGEGPAQPFHPCHLFGSSGCSKHEGLGTTRSGWACRG